MTSIGSDGDSGVRDILLLFINDCWVGPQFVYLLNLFIFCQHYPCLSSWHSQIFFHKCWAKNMCIYIYMYISSSTNCWRKPISVPQDKKIRPCPNSNTSSTSGYCRCGARFLFSSLYDPKVSSFYFQWTNSAQERKRQVGRSRRHGITCFAYPFIYRLICPTKCRIGALAPLILITGVAYLSFFQMCTMHPEIWWILTNSILN